MKINRHNYEAYLLDQLEGRLSVEDQLELERFLMQNPDCIKENLDLESWILKDQKLRFPERKLLKKDLPEHSTVLGDHNFDMYSIARMEGDLLEEQIAEHQALLEANDQKAKEWQQWQQTILTAEQVFFHEKDRLKHKTVGRRRMLWISISAAAAVTLLLVLFRTQPEVPRQDSYTRAPRLESATQAIQEDNAVQAAQEELSGQGQAAPLEKEAQKAAMDSEPMQNTPGIAATELQQDKDSLGTAIGADPVMTLAANEPMPRAISFSAQQFSSASMVREAHPDQIKPLNLVPDPVSVNSLYLAQISEWSIQEIVEDYAEQKDISLWKIAEAGIKGINKVTGSDISLLASRDEEGEVSGIRLKSKRFSFTGPINRGE